MEQIRIHRHLSTGLHGDFKSVSTIEIDEKPFSEGAFGIVYFCHSVNSKKTAIPQIIKIFKEANPGDLEHNYKTIKQLQTKLEKKNLELLKQGGKPLTEVLPAFKGVPQFSFEGILKGKRVKGFSANNLKSMGFTEFKEILEDETLLDGYQKAELDQKLLIAYHFVSAFDILREFLYIHADIKPEAIFVNTSTNECALIDFDSGVITEKPTDEPNTWGANNDWIAPEIWEQLKSQNNKSEKIRVSLNSDVWSVMIGVHYFLTTVHPLFYLSEVSPRTINEYFLHSKWPNIQKKSWYFNNESTDIYDTYLSWINTLLPEEVKKLISTTINYGYKDPVKRASYGNWKKVLFSAQKPPEFKLLEIDRPVVVNGVETTISWAVEGAHTIMIDNHIGKVPAQGKITVSPSKNTLYTINAIGYFGETPKTCLIKVFPTPIMESLLVPVPDFSKTIKFEMPQVAAPHIDVSIRFNNIEGPTTFPFDAPPIEWERLSPIKKEKSSFWNFSKLFHEIQKKILGRTSN